MNFLLVFLWPFKSGSYLTPSAFTNNTSFIIPRILKLLFQLVISILFRSFKIIPPFPPQGCFLVTSYLFENKNLTVYLTSNAQSKRGCYSSFSYSMYWLTSKIDYGATTICSSSSSALSVFFTSLFLRVGIPFLGIFALTLTYPKGVVEIVLLFVSTIKK